MPFNKALSLLVLAMLSLVAPALRADSETVRKDMQEGIAFFTEGQYEKAAASFKHADQDAAATADQKSAALFWTAKSYIGLGRFPEAQKSIERYLADYPKGADAVEAFYQKGRLAFMQEEYEGAIQVLEDFLAVYPDSPFAANAYFWTGESLFNLGKLDEATEIYRKVLKDYPSSFKIEATQYKLSLIDLSRREVELAKLLKWSHEEFLRRSEEFQRREKTYEQAMEAYKKKLTAPEQAEFEKSIAGLKAELETKTAEALQLSASLEEARIAAQTAPETPAAKPVETAAPVSPAPAADAEAALTSAQQELLKRKEALDRLLALLDIKEKALDLKERYLEWLESNGGAQ
jgi:TolA-binding protein